MTQWLSIERAAELYAARVKIADLERCKRVLLEAVLNETLKISVRFRTPTKGKKGILKRQADLDGIKEVSPNLFPYSTSPPSKKNSLLACIGLWDVDGVFPDFEDLRFEYASPTLLPVARIWDLLLIGNGCYYVEELLDKNFEIPEMSLAGGIYVQNPEDRSIYELHSVETYISGDGQEDTLPLSLGELPKGATFVFRQEAIAEFFTAIPSSQLPSDDQQKVYAEEYLLPEVQGRLESERIKLEDLPTGLKDEFKKLVVNLAEEKPGTVNDILLIGDTNDNQLKTFLAATKVALEIVSLSKLIEESKGADDLISRFRKVDISQPTTYGADSRSYRHWVIRQLEAFPFTVEANSSGFADIQRVARIVATTSPNSQTPLPRAIEELFKIKVYFGTFSEVQAENGGEVSAALAGAPPAKEDRERANGYKEIAELLGVGDRMVKNYASRKGFPLHKGTTGRIYVFKDELLEWHKRHKETYIKRRKENARRRGKRK